MNVADWLAATARQRPGAPALLLGSKTVRDYAGFAGIVSAIARSLRDEHGVLPGDRVAIFMANSTQYLECLFGVLWAGAVVVPLNAKLHGREAWTILRDADAVAVFVSLSSAEELRSTRAPEDADLPLLEVTADTRLSAAALGTPVKAEWDDLAWLFYTSGTTGRPKGVMLSHGNLISMSLCYLADVDSVEPTDAVLYAAPMSHGAGLYAFIHVRRGARHVIPPSGGFDPEEILDLAADLRGVSLFAAPTMVRRLTDAARRRDRPGDGVKTIVYGGGPMYEADLQDALNVLGEKFVQIYGQGESPMTITALSREWHTPEATPRRASVGTAQSAVSVRITGKDESPLVPRATGEIEVKGATVMLGYWRNPEATGETIRDGWLRTGDLGYLDGDGFLTLTGRSKEVVISGGSNVYPREVEDVLVSHLAVREAAVIGLPDEEWGELVVACVVTEPDAVVSSEDLDAHFLRSLARFKRPRRYLTLPCLPKNSYGKVLKDDLRRQCLPLTNTKE